MNTLLVKSMNILSMIFKLLVVCFDIPDSK